MGLKQRRADESWRGDDDSITVELTGRCCDPPALTVALKRDRRRLHVDVIAEFIMERVDDSLSTALTP